MWKKGWRDQLWVNLQQHWDLIIIGGGITGAGILREAVHAGLKTLLLEGKDFASGTSSRSSKLVHGGLRYLRHGQIRTTIASVNERERLLKEGRGLISPLGFLYVCFKGDKIPLWVVGAGLAMYDVLGLRWGHKRYSRQAVRKLSPSLNVHDVQGGYRYFDAQTDDARLVIRVIREAVRDGGMALNYAMVRDLLCRLDGRVCGVLVEDVSGEREQRTLELQAKVVVNATGFAADDLRKKADHNRHLRLLRGSHLIFPARRFPLIRAVSYCHPQDGRPIFAIPWEGVTLFGTTDVDHRQQGLSEPTIEAEEVDYLFAAIRHGFPSLSLTEYDVQSTFSGIRAVVDSGKSDPSSESREHVIWPEDGLLTVTGGKLTTFRVMARDALKAVRRWFPDRPDFGDHRTLDVIEPLKKDEFPLKPWERNRLIGRYGHDVRTLLSHAKPDELSAISTEPDLSTIWAEVRWAAHAEGVVHLDDLLLRRVRLGLLLPDGADTIMERIRTIVQDELDWNHEHWEFEINRFRRQMRQAYSI